jgi:RNase P/RNase MRP subunit POP5
VTTKTRSPNYPVISLPDAIGRVQTVYSKEHTHPSTREVIAKALGYSSLNGASAVVISALNKYGLLEGSREQFRVSMLALDIILHPPGDTERRRAIQSAAFAPTLFSELREQYGYTLPSDVNLRASLIKKGFNPKTVDGVIRVYRDTLEFVDKEEQASKTNGNDILSFSPSATSLTGSNINEIYSSATIPLVKEEENGVVLWFRIARDCEVRTEFKGRVTQEAVQKFIKHLELSIEDFPNRFDIQEAKDSLDE